MANALTELSCGTVTSADPPASPEEVAAYMELLPGWRIIEVHGVRRLRRVVEFPDFAAALDFTNAVGRLAEQEHHHPATVTEWGKVTVTIWTFAIRALHRNDFILAAKIDEIAAQPAT